MANDDEKKEEKKEEQPTGGKVMVSCGRHGLTDAVRWSGTSNGQSWSTAWYCFRCHAEDMVRMIGERHMNEGLSVTIVPDDDAANTDDGENDEAPAGDGQEGGEES